MDVLGVIIFIVVIMIIFKFFGDRFLEWLQYDVLHQLEDEPEWFARPRLFMNSLGNQKADQMEQVLKETPAAQSSESLEYTEFLAWRKQRQELQHAEDNLELEFKKWLSQGKK